MTTSLDLHRFTAALRRAAVRGTLAPSVHNTQPWRMEFRSSRLSIVADPARKLTVLDPTGRQMLISCGCALFNVRVALAAAGLSADVTRLPDPARPDLLAHVVADDVSDGTVDPIAYLDALIELRHTNRRQFADDEVPSEVIESLENAAAAEGGLLFEVRRPEHRLALARLSQRADEMQNADAAYRAELRAWTTNDLARLDGVPTSAVPVVDGRSRDDVPVRDFDTSGMALLPARTRSSRNQCLLLLGTKGDNPGTWLRAGEALQRVLLEVTRHGFAACPLTQVIEVPQTRASLRADLGLSMSPHILLRVGRAPVTPATRRRRLADVFLERS